MGRVAAHSINIFMKSIITPILALTGLILLSAGYPIGIGLWVLAAVLCSPQLRHSLCVFPSNCAGRIIEVSKSTGCSLALSTVRAWTSEDLENNALKEVGYDMEFSRLQEARLAGYRESTLMELVLSRVGGVPKPMVQRRPVKGNKSMVFPFIQMTQRRNINIQHWTVASGAPNPSAGAGDVHPGAWDLIISNHSGAFASDLPSIQNYFLPGRTLFVSYASAAGVSINLAYKILAAVASGDNAKVTVEPNYTAGRWGALSAADKLKYQIGGVAGGAAEAGTGATIGANSVSDYESYREKDTALNNLSLLNFPMQTSRIMWEYTDQWVKLLNNPLMGTYFKKYWQLPEAEQRRQHQKLFDQALLESVFFGQRINENQSAVGDAYQDLPVVVDPANDNCELEYKTNAEGIQTQLINCGRFIDMAGGPLDLDDMFARLYTLKRAREADSNDVTDIDIMGDRHTAGNFEKIMADFLKKYYGFTWVDQVTNGKVMDQDRKQVVFNYRTWTLPQEFGGIRINFFTHPYFDDRLAAHSAAASQRMIWIIDWTDIFMGIIKTNQRNTQTNEADEIYRYVIDINKKHVMNQSITWSLIMQDPNRHLIYRNFSAACPSVTVSMCTATTPA